jgi:hypothetical protein
LRLIHESGFDECSFEGLVELFSSSISEIESSSLSELSVDLLRLILSHRSVKIPSEDWLYDFVKSQMTRDTSYSTLLELIHYEYLSLELIHDFTQLICETFEILTYPVWLSLIPRLTYCDSRSGLNAGSHHQIDYREGGNLHGILSFLTWDSGGNVHDRGIVRVSASSKHRSDYPVQLIVDSNSSLSRFATKDAANSWICIDFKHHHIKATHYSIRSRTDYDGRHLQSWSLEGLTICGEWVELDCRRGLTELVGIGVVRTFSIGHICEVRSVRLRQTGVNSSSNNNLVLKSLELFGELSDLSRSFQ